MKLHIELDLTTPGFLLGPRGTELARVLRELAAAADAKDVPALLEGLPNTLRDNTLRPCGRVWAAGCWSDKS